MTVPVFTNHSVIKLLVYFERPQKLPQIGENYVRDDWRDEAG